jgi:Protein of unknown function (DUF3054)
MHREKCSGWASVSSLSHRMCGSATSEAQLEHQKRSEAHPRVHRLSPVLDLAMLVAFVAIGGRAHDLQSSASWFFVVLWPLALGWFAAALVFHAYGSGGTSWLRILLTWAIGMTVALFLRVVITGRPTPLPFVLVLLVFTGVTMLGWRVCQRLISSQRAGNS